MDRLHPIGIEQVAATVCGLLAAPSRDGAAVVSSRRLAEDSAIITEFTERVMSDTAFPLGHAVCDKVKKDLDNYFHRKH